MVAILKVPDSSLLFQTKDCNVMASKLMFLLDDLLWVLTDSQLKAMMKYAESLSEAMEKSAQQRKSLAPESVQVSHDFDVVCQEKGKDRVKETVSVCVASGPYSQSISLVGTGRLT